MAGEQIDSLTVGIGLTSDEFKDGVSEILGAINGMKKTTEDAAEGMGASFAAMGDSVAGLALKFTGMFFAIRGIEDVVGYFKDLSHELANLSWAGEYLGQSSVQLSRFGEVAKLAGGQADDAVRAVSGLQAAIFGLEYNGQMSQNLLMLNRLRVAYTDSQGNMLPIEQIAMNAAKALQDQLGSGKQTEAMRVQWAAQIFGQGGLANAIGGGVAELRKFYADAAKDQKGITQKVIDHQRELQQDMVRLSYSLKSVAADALDKLTKEIRELINEIRLHLLPKLKEIAKDFDEMLHPEATVETGMSSAGVGPLGLNHPINTIEAIGIGLGIRAGQVHDWWAHIMGRNDIEKRMPASVVTAMNKAGARDVDMSQLVDMYMAAGGGPGDAATNTALWAKVLNQFTQSGEATPYFHPFWSNVVATPTTPRPPMTPTAPRHHARAAGHPTASLSGPRVAIGTVNVNAPNARDANGIAASIDRALQRKLLVAQSDPGLA